MHFRKAPILAQFIAMLLRPFDHQRQGSFRQASLDYFQSVYRNDSTFAAVIRVEMRRCVIIVIHADFDSEESADGRHGNSVIQSGVPMPPYPGNDDRSGTNARPADDSGWLLFLRLLLMKIPLAVSSFPSKAQREIHGLRGAGAWHSRCAAFAHPAHPRTLGAVGAASHRAKSARRSRELAAV